MTCQTPGMLGVAHFPRDFDFFRSCASRRCRDPSFGDSSAPQVRQDQRFGRGATSCFCSCGVNVWAERDFRCRAFAVAFSFVSLVTSGLLFADLVACGQRFVGRNLLRCDILTLILASMRQDSRPYINFEAHVEWQQRHEFLKCACGSRSICSTLKLMVQQS